MNIQELAKDGFSLHNHKKRELDIALISLKIGLAAYYSTYAEVKRNFWVMETRENENRLEIFREEILIANYAKAYIETIFHFHHFIEVSIKEILRQEHKLLASTASREHIIIHKLLMGDEVTATEMEELYSLEFREATERLIELIKEQRITNHQNMGFIRNSNDFLTQINKLRNRLVHRGTFVLRYTALDIFVGKYIFPFVLKLLDLPIYKNSKFEWQPKQLHCHLDPMQKIIKECSASKPNFSKIAFLKEMGRAAYINPLLPQPKGVKFRETTKEDAEKRAKKELEDPEVIVIDVQICPVCGAESLVRYGDTQPDGETEEVSSIYCFCCSFWVDSELSSVRLDGLAIQNYWQLPSR